MKIPNTVYSIGLFSFVCPFLSGLSLAQVNENETSESSGSVPYGKLCSTEQIQSAQVDSCLCSVGKSDECVKCSLPACNGKALVSTSQLLPNHCQSGCVDSNRVCDSCYIWFVQLCHCLQNNNCQIYPSSTGQHPWVLTYDRKLITTTWLTPGIMQLDSEDPWTFGQSLQREALALNSVQSRDEEQIHIHVCTGNSGVKKRLSGLDPEDYKTLQEVPKTSWKCRVNPKVGGTINGVTAEIRTAIHFASCKEEVGAAVIVDNDDRSWMCIAEEWGAIEHTFCQ